MTLEDKLLQDIEEGNEIDLERGMFIICGCDTEKKVQEYHHKLDLLMDQFTDYKKTRTDIDKRFKINCAELVHDFIWDGSDNLYEEDQDKITTSIDSLLHHEEKVGNCLALTCLEASMYLRLGYEVKILFSPRHVKLKLEIKNQEIEIETTLEDGFDEEDETRYKETNPLEIFAHILESRSYHRNSALASLADLIKAKKILQSDQKIYEGLGFYFKEIGSFECARVNYHRAIKLGSNSFRVYDKLGQIYEKRYSLEKALKFYLKAIKFPEAKLSFCYNLGERCQKIGKKEEALKFYNKALSSEDITPPYERSIHFHCGKIHRENNELQKALTSFKDAEKSGYFNSELYYYLGLVNSGLGEKKIAIENFCEAIRKNPNQSEYYYSLANEQRGIGDMEKATENYRAGLRLNQIHNETLEGFKNNRIISRWN
jgi:tetratricopeptide (TPR) repeat protein